MEFVGRVPAQDLRGRGKMTEDRDALRHLVIPQEQEGEAGAQPEPSGSSKQQVAGDRQGQAYPDAEEDGGAPGSAAHQFAGEDCRNELQPRIHGCTIGGLCGITEFPGMLMVRVGDDLTVGNQFIRITDPDRITGLEPAHSIGQQRERQPHNDQDDEEDRVLATPGAWLGLPFLGRVLGHGAGIGRLISAGSGDGR